MCAFRVQRTAEKHAHGLKQMCLCRTSSDDDGLGGCARPSHAKPFWLCSHLTPSPLFRPRTILAGPSLP